MRKRSPVYEENSARLSWMWKRWEFESRAAEPLRAESE